MLVVACIKQVPDTTQVKVDPVTGTLIREGVPFIMNPFDTHALEESLRLKDRYRLRVVVISMGPPSTEVTLRKALAAGADEAVLLSDRAFGGADTLATSLVLAEAVKRLAQQEEVAVVLCGVFLPTFALQILDVVLASAIFIVLVAWAVWYFLKTLPRVLAERRAAVPAAVPAAPLPAEPPAETRSPFQDQPQAESEEGGQADD